MALNKQSKLCPAMVHDTGYVISHNSLPLYLIKGNIGSLPADSRSIYVHRQKFLCLLFEGQTDREESIISVFKLLIVKK